MDHRAELLKDVLAEAMGMEDQEQRAAFVARSCGDDLALRREVEELIRAAGAAGRFLPARPKTNTAAKALLAIGEAMDSAMTSAIPLTEKAGDRIGRYKLLQKIGEGGCGIVYMAEQEEPVRRMVALKVIKLGMDTKAVVARFEAERQALALMDHPNIAKVLDAGATDAGRPYFVMELIKGIKITEYADQNQLPTRERLQLFMAVCQAVQHAHQKGIIHRDLKPSNILVTLDNAEAVPKVIDFGIAKATAGRLTDQTLFTAFEQFLGTPAYMSPEQAVMTSLDIDTRSDIYSLGVLLYELLTGRTPFDTKALLAAGLDEMRRTIRDEEPARPSTCLRTMVEGELNTAARHRRAEPAKLRHLLTGDLDWIAMKCLEKDRRRRYETAYGLAMDIRRHLANEPVQARPPSATYRFQKLVRRNKIAFGAAGLVAASLICGLGVSTWQFLEKDAAYRRAVEAESEQTHLRLAAQKAKDEATEELWTSYVAQARAKRTSGNAGQRHESLEAVIKASAIHRNLVVRNEAIASLALCDLRRGKVAKHFTSLSSEADLRYAENLEQYAVKDEEGNIRVYATEDDHEITALRAGSPAYWIYGFSPDGRLLAVGYSNPGNVYETWVWDVATAKPVLRGLPEDRPGDAFSSDSHLFAWSAWNNPEDTLSIYELGSGQLIQRLASAGYRRLAFSPSNTRIAGTRPGTSALEIRSLQDGSAIYSKTTPPEINCLAWSPDGKSIVTGSTDGTIRIWNAEDGLQKAALQGHTDSIVSIKFNSEGNLIASSSWDDTIRLWSADNGRQLVKQVGSYWQIQFSADDRRVAALHQGPQIGLLEVSQSREYRRVYSSRTGPWIADPVGPEFSSDGSVLAAWIGDGVRFWDVEAGREVAYLPMQVCNALMFHVHDDALISVDKSSVYSRSLQRVPGSAQEHLRLSAPRELYRGRGFYETAQSLDGHYLGALGGTGDIVLLDLNKPSNEVQVASQPGSQYLAVSPDGHWVAAGSRQEPAVRVWDAQMRRLVQTLPASIGAKVVFSPDGRWLGVSSTQYQLWEVGSWQRRNPPIPGYPTPHFDNMAFSPDSRMIAVVNEDRNAQLIDTLTGTPLATLEPPDPSMIVALRFSPSGNYLSALQRDGQLQLWDLRLVRQELAPMGLDWDLPAFPPVARSSVSGPITVELENKPSGRKVLTQPLPPRDAKAPPELLDLSRYYNASLTESWHPGVGRSDLSEIPIGTQVLSGVRFDVRGLIQIGATSRNQLDYPNEILGIPVRRTCRGLQFLHAAIFAAGVADGKHIGTYVIHYASGARTEIPIILGETLADWWSQPNEDRKSFAIAWSGWNDESRRQGRQVRLFKTTWENPLPAEPIATLDFLANPPGPAPFLVAVSAE